MQLTALLLTSLSSLSRAALLWDGRFNTYKSAADLSAWSWSNQVGPYQYYIHGSAAVDKYVELSAAHKNPADTTSQQGAKLTLDGTAYWNGQTMRRIELIPQVTAGSGAINAGKVYYHFSMAINATNAPSAAREHQINFFESHFTEMKYGWLSGEPGDANPKLQWMVGGKSLWSVPVWEPGVWHNVAYEIDFAGKTVGFWHSTGGEPLQLAVAPVAASPASDGKDFHVGVLELPRDGHPDTTEDFYMSGVYIESGTLTTTIGAP